MSTYASLTTSFPWWPRVGAPLANHLWQSTLFAVGVWLLALVFKRNRAQTRYGLWPAASLKFLLPFSLLVGVGSHLPWSVPTTAMQTGFFVAFQGINEPFTPNHTVVPLDTSAHALAPRLLSFTLLALWFCGFAAVQVHWWLRLRRITSGLRGVGPCTSGREHEALQRVQRSMGIITGLKLMISNTTLEPGILGVFHPFLLLPNGIADRLTDAQLDAIVRHELCHVRRRDNLAAAFHMFAQSMFWFHPFVWWIGTRLISERERACDEEVLNVGGDPRVYAEGILKVCEFYLVSPLPCAGGVTGANLKKRIEAIMTNNTPLHLDLARKLLLFTAAVLALFVPLGFGVLHATPSRAQSRFPNMLALLSFTNVSIRPNTSTEQGPTILYGHDSFSAENTTLRELIRESFGVQNAQIVGPDWLDSSKYDVNATVDSAALPDFRKLGADQQRLMLQPVLAEHFKLVTHRETRVMPVYALAVAQSGSKLLETAPTKGSSPFGTFTFAGEGQLTARSVPLSQLVEYLAMRVDRVVLDETGLKGKYNFVLQLPPNATFGPATSAVFKAIEDQLGLKLESSQDPVEVLVIDHVEKPLEN